MNPVPTWQDIAQQQHDSAFMPAQTESKPCDASQIATSPMVKRYAKLFEKRLSCLRQSQSLKGSLSEDESSR